ncbi:MAG: DUF2628 domain-containing protein [Pseudorhodoplanes sp.]|jgi:hypothetical protein|nr:DUF2628 domain-containing protein [Pseudorhodoplanes sp.]
MAVYTVHQPPLRKGETAPDPDRFVLVRDGFYFWAFLLGPLWMVWRRLWLVLALYIAVMVGVGFALQLVSASTGLRVFVLLAMAILVGLEAGTLRRWTLGWRGWKNVGVVVGDDRDAAERRFFSEWIDSGQKMTRAEAIKPRTGGVRMPKGNSPDVIGLFPEADKPR